MATRVAPLALGSGPRCPWVGCGAKHCSEHSGCGAQAGGEAAWEGQPAALGFGGSF